MFRVRRSAAFRRLSLAAVVFAAATLAGLYFATQLTWAYPQAVRRSFADAAAINLAYYWSWALAVPLVLATARRFRLAGRRIALSVAMHAAVSTAVTVLLIVLVTVVLTFAGYGSKSLPLGAAVLSSVRMNFHSFYPTYWLIVFAFYAWDYMRQSRAHELRAAEIGERLARAELDALRAQLEPHFLFNTLNSISSLMYTDVDAADRMMTRLAQLLRSAIDRKGEQEVALRDELALVAGYVEIEKIRFEERLDVQFDVSSAALEARVPSLILQPLMENAIRHGLGDRPEGGRLRVSAAVQGEALHLRIIDDGVGVATAEERIGIGNTRARLQALYGDGASLRLDPLPSGGSVAEVVMPYRRSA